MRVVVVGAGVAGLVTAIHLAERGASVEVLERGARLGESACAWAAGGMIAPWCEAETGEEEAARLGPEALDWWPRQIDEVAVEGTLVVASRRDQAELSRFSRRTDHFEWADAARVAELEPDLAGRFERALFFPEEAHVDPRAALPALQRRFEALGGRIRLGAAANPDDIDADAVVDCRGFGARDALKELRGVRGEMVLLRTDEVSLKRPVRLLHPRIALYVIPRADHVFMIGATAIESASRAKISARSAVELINGAYALHSAFGEAEVVETCAEVRPSFPDNLPRVVRDGRVVRVNGLYRNGFLLSPTFGRLAADAVFELEKSSEADRQRLAS
ncbi:glycine oxidase ThiO [Chelatococcus sambhunathii]|uniref:D-amino-acid oxidase n=2 Tax=Chelatococcus sambhunathii TaxID=363953 RepID=A0ABU1DB95_9HYPH|nr:glycine oxidase ThiO [Chelatococcus sambhunathii]MDR4305195.1 glycine oxidase ThiO [Chelatococcus sambhunathii]